MITDKEYDALDEFAKCQNEAPTSIFDNIAWDGRSRKIEVSGKRYEVCFRRQNNLPVYRDGWRVGEFRYSAQTAGGTWYFCA